MWGRMTQNKPGAFPYPCSDDSRTLCLLWPYIALGSFGMFFGVGQCPSISDRVCVNSRTLDIGNARERISPQTV